MTISLRHCAHPETRGLAGEVGRLSESRVPSPESRFHIRAASPESRP